MKRGPYNKTKRATAPPIPVSEAEKMRDLLAEYHAAVRGMEFAATQDKRAMASLEAVVPRVKKVLGLDWRDSATA